MPIKTPTPQDSRLDFETYRTVVETVKKVLRDGGGEYVYDNYMFRVAKITNIGTVGDYSAKEVTWNKTNAEWRLLTGGIIWDSSSTDVCRYPDLVILNDTDVFDVDSIVIVFSNPRGHNAWTIVSTGGSSGFDNWFHVSYFIGRATPESSESSQSESGQDNQLWIQVQDGLFLSPTGFHVPTFADIKVGSPGEYDYAEITQYFEGPLVFALSNSNSTETMVGSVSLDNGMLYSTNKAVIYNYGLKVQSIANYSTSLIYEIGDCDDDESSETNSMSSASTSSVSSQSESSESSGGLYGSDYEFNIFFTITHTDAGVETYVITRTKQDLVYYTRTDATYPGYTNGKCVWNVKLAHVNCVNESSSSQSEESSSSGAIGSWSESM
jgi:hypothetical protein